MLAHFPVFNTGSATYASHLDITKCRWGILQPGAEVGYSDAITQGCTPCKPIDEYTPNAQRGPCDWGDKAGVSAANGATSLVATCWRTSFMGST